MSFISRVGDQNEMGGSIMMGATTVIAEGQPVGLVGGQMSEHAPWDQDQHPPHICASITSGTETVLVYTVLVAGLPLLA